MLLLSRIRISFGVITATNLDTPVTAVSFFILIFGDVDGVEAAIALFLVGVQGEVVVTVPTIQHLRSTFLRQAQFHLLIRLV